MSLFSLEKLMQEAFGAPEDKSKGSKEEPVVSKLAAALDQDPVGRSEVGLAKLLISLDILSQ